MNREFLVVEYSFDPPATDALFAEHGHKLEPCLAARQVEWVHSYVSADRRRRKSPQFRRVDLREVD